MIGTLNKIQFLREISLFRELSFEDIIAISHISNRKWFDAETVIFRQNDLGDSLYVVVEGEVEIILESSNDEQLIACLGKKACFGEMAVLDDELRSATAKVRSAALTLQIERKDFRECLRINPTLAFKMLRLLSNRIRDINEKLLKQNQ